MTSRKRIYLDNNATTPIDPKVISAVIDDLTNHSGNPSSTHTFGQDARQRLNNARKDIASFFGVPPREMIFTSGGTEAISMAIYGLLPQGGSGHIITSQAEHSAVYNTVKDLEKKGYDASYLPIGLWGAVTPEAVLQAIRKDTKLIILIAANNETGVRTDIEAIAQITHQANIPFIVDAVALLGKAELPKPLPQGISALCFSGHKIHAPKGIGLLYISKHLKFTPMILGGDQEYKRRAGTENMTGIIGIAEAIRLLQQDMPGTIERIHLLRDRLEKGIRAVMPSVIINGTGSRICNTSNLAFPNVDGESLLINLDLEGIAVSHGSACSSGALEPSRILLQMGIPLELARSSIRFSLSRYTTVEEIDKTIEVISHLI